jgi:hypothetical protein
MRLVNGTSLAKEHGWHLNLMINQKNVLLKYAKEKKRDSFIRSTNTEEDGLQFFYAKDRYKENSRRMANPSCFTNGFVDKIKN